MMNASSSLYLYAALLIAVVSMLRMITGPHSPKASFLIETARLGANP